MNAVRVQRGEKVLAGRSSEGNARSQSVSSDRNFVKKALRFAIPRMHRICHPLDGAALGVVLPQFGNSNDAAMKWQDVGADANRYFLVMTVFMSQFPPLQCQVMVKFQASPSCSALIPLSVVMGEFDLSVTFSASLYFRLPLTKACQL